jgi:membrane fusion protein (multidrug efflux system)
VLKPGFFAKGTIALKVDDNVMVVPDDTVSTLAGVSTVYVIEDGKARQQIVSLGSREGKQWEIVDGLKGTETLAASQLNQLATGMSVTTGDSGGPSGGSGGGRGRGRGRGQGQAGGSGGGQ